MLSVSDLNVRYGMHEALNSVSLNVALDEIVVILGANGAGKSTLLSAIAGNCVGSVDGQILLSGEQLRSLDTAQIVEHGIAFVPEGRGVFSDLSVEENLRLGSYADHARHDEKANLANVLALFPKLQERKKQIVRTMSGGEQQMVAIGRALMSAPSILMLDEPSLGLSPLLCKELFSSLKQVRDSGVGILLVEQNAKQSLSIADRGYLLGNGRIIGEDSAENLLNDASVQAAYLGGAMSSQTASVTPISSGHAGTSHVAAPAMSAGIGITPTGSGQNTQRVSSNDLLTENVGALVARASSRAAQHRTAGANIPPQVVKLTSRSSAVLTDNVVSRSTTNNGAASLNTESSALKPDSTTPNKANSRKAGVPPVSEALPQTQDKKVQALLAEFETAAKNAVSKPKSNEYVAQTRSTSANQVDDTYPLPHVPVYKKSNVTVYRRDDTGNLRKQEEP